MGATQRTSERTAHFVLTINYELYTVAGSERLDNFKLQGESQKTGLEECQSTGPPEQRNSGIPECRRVPAFCIIMYVHIA